MKQFLPYLLISLFLTAQSAIAQTWGLVGNAGLSAGQAHYISLDLKSDNTPYIAYRDASVTEKITVQSYDGSSWSDVGSKGFTAGQADYIDLEIDNNDVPYVAYQDKANSNTLSVMKYDGTNWVQVGSAGITSGSIFYAQIAFDGTTPYVAFSDFSSSLGGKISVMTFDGTNWNYLGSAGFSAGRGYFVSLKIHNGSPYVAFRDQGNSFKATVMKFESSSWLNVGSAGFTPGGAEYTSLAIDASGTPYLAYQDENIVSPASNANGASVMKYDGSSWTQVGSAGFSTGEARFLDIKIAPNGVPNLVFRDFGLSSKAVVMSYDSGTSSWLTVGNPGFSAGICSDMNLEIFSNGHLFVAYKDFGNGLGATVNDFIGNIVPIELQSFTGEVKAEYNVLRWETATELNNDYFVIERSRDGLQFEEVNHTDGAGTSQTVQAYEMRDFTPFPKLTFYRLKQVDYDGTYSYSETITLNEFVSEAALMDIFPNPSRGSFRLLANLSSIDEQAETIQVVNLNGQVVYEQQLFGEGFIRKEITLGQVMPGIYLVQILTSQRKFHKRLLVRP